MSYYVIASIVFACIAVGFGLLAVCLLVSFARREKASKSPVEPFRYETAKQAKAAQWRAHKRRLAEIDREYASVV